MTTIMQPFQCDLQTQTQETHRTTHTEITTRCRTQRRNQFAHETTAAATAAHRRYLSSPPAATLHGKTHGFVLRLPPQHEPHATFMQPSRIYAHGNTRWQQSCSHSGAICKYRLKKRRELRTYEQPLVAEHRGGTDYARNDPSRNRRAQEVPFIAGCSDFTRKSTRCCAPASSHRPSSMYCYVM